MRASLASLCCTVDNRPDAPRYPSRFDSCRTQGREPIVVCGRTILVGYSRSCRKLFFPPPLQTHHARLRIAEDAVQTGSRTKPREAIGVPQSSLFPHPQIMPDFLFAKIVDSPSYVTSFSCYFYPLDREVLQMKGRPPLWSRPVLFHSLSRALLEKLFLRYDIKML
jgi:hypothetical protein